MNSMTSIMRIDAGVRSMDLKMEKFALKNNIRILRFNYGEMTQQQLADRIGVSRQTIVAIEKGRCSPSLILAFKIARVFNLSMEEIFFMGIEVDAL